MAFRCDSSADSDTAGAADSTAGAAGAGVALAGAGTAGAGVAVAGAGASGIDVVDGVVAAAAGIEAGTGLDPIVVLEGQGVGVEDLVVSSLRPRRSPQHEDSANSLIHTTKIFRDGREWKEMSSQ
mgnify:CR=1 FL=1